MEDVQYLEGLLIFIKTFPHWGFNYISSEWDGPDCYSVQ